jgi:hypothetical protein
VAAVTDATGAAEHGHLFLVDGDLTALAVDVALIPTDDELHLEAPWRDLVDPATVTPGPQWPDRPVEVRLSADGGNRRARLVSVGPATTDVRLDDASVSDAVARLLTRVSRAVEDVAAAAQRAGLRRARPLVGLPLLGTGGGGLFARRSTLIRRLVEHLWGLLATAPVDVVLVVHQDREHLALCRRERRRTGALPAAEEVAARWRTGAGDRTAGGAAEHVHRLLRATRARELVPFFGAGISRGSGGPDWDDLLDELAASTPEPETRRLLGTIADPFDRAQVIAETCEGGLETLDRRTRERLVVRAPSLAHVLLADLRARDAVTTNYDDGYEQAVTLTGREVAVVPRRGPQRVLKLHGDIHDDRSSLVLTREQLLEAQRDDRTLAGALQMLLLTGHLLFVGYSLRDPDLHAALHEVQRVFRQRGGRPEDLATSLQVEPSEPLSLLWSGAVAVLWPDPERYPDVASAARQVEILLDVLVDTVDDTQAPLLAPGVDDRDLDVEERRLRAALLDLAAAYRSAVARGADVTGTWASVGDLLDRHGHRDAASEPQPFDPRPSTGGGSEDASTGDGSDVSDEAPPEVAGSGTDRSGRSAGPSSTVPSAANREP